MLSALHQSYRSLGQNVPSSVLIQQAWSCSNKWANVLHSCLGKNSQSITAGQTGNGDVASCSAGLATSAHANSKILKSPESKSAAEKRANTQKLQEKQQEKQQLVADAVRQGNVNTALLGKPNNKTGIPRALSAYIFFMKDQMPMLKKECENVKASELSKLGGARWLEMSEEQKAKYFALAQQSKEQAAALRTGLKAARSRPLTSYALYVKEHVPKLKKTYPNLAVPGLMRMAAQMWHSLPDADKEQRRSAYQKAVEEYKKGENKGQEDE